MLGVIEPDTHDIANCDLAASASSLTLARNECLFRAGEIKTKLYRIESGLLCIYMTRPDLTFEPVEFAVAGDVVGLGFLESHATSARAVVDTKVTCFPREFADRLIADDPRAAARLAVVVEREFEFQRRRRVEEGTGKPIVRLAAFLAAVSRQNSDEGRDPDLVEDTLNCAVMADHLGMRLDVLALALMQLQLRGLVQPSSDRGLRLIDVGALEALT